LDAAERLFAESGLEGISLRRVAAAAGVNSAAVHYHFGSREALVEAVLLRRVEALQTRRRLLLEAIPDAEGPDALRGLVEALVLPWAEIALGGGRPGHAYVKLLARLYADGDAFVSEFVTHHFSDIYQEFGARTERALPDLPRPVLHRRLVLVVQGMLHALAESEIHGALAGGSSTIDDDQRTRELIDFLLGGLCAPIGRTATHTGTSE
jgi:AcrR family transcriptional regulator